MLTLGRFKYVVSLFLVKLVYCIMPRVSHDMVKLFQIFLL